MNIIIYNYMRDVIAGSTCKDLFAMSLHVFFWKLYVSMIQVIQVCTSDTSMFTVSYNYHITQKIYRVFLKNIISTAWIFTALSIYLKEIWHYNIFKRSENRISQLQSATLDF